MSSRNSPRVMPCDPGLHVDVNTPVIRDGNPRLHVLNQCHRANRHMDFWLDGIQKKEERGCMNTSRDCANPTRDGVSLRLGHGRHGRGRHQRGTRGGGGGGDLGVELLQQRAQLPARQRARKVAVQDLGLGFGF
jgi:hypothetical protein